MTPVRLNPYPPGGGEPVDLPLSADAEADPSFRPTDNARPQGTPFYLRFPAHGHCQWGASRGRSSGLETLGLRRGAMNSPIRAWHKVQVAD
jgi:hypothetical protein